MRTNGWRGSYDTRDAYGRKCSTEEGIELKRVWRCTLHPSYRDLPAAGPLAVSNDALKRGSLICPKAICSRRISVRARVGCSASHFATDPTLSARALRCDYSLMTGTAHDGRREYAAEQQLLSKQSLGSLFGAEARAFDDPKVFL